ARDQKHGGAVAGLGVVELLRGFVGLRDGVAADRYDDVAGLQALLFRRAAVGDARDQDAVDRARDAEGLARAIIEIGQRETIPAIAALIGARRGFAVGLAGLELLELHRQRRFLLVAPDR